MAYDRGRPLVGFGDGLPNSEELAELSPAMAALVPRQRAFVYHYATNGGNATNAVKAAGYSPKSPNYCRVMAHKLLHSKPVLEALHSVGWAVLHGLTMPALSALSEIIADHTHKDRARAVDMVLSRTGFMNRTEHNVTVQKSEMLTLGKPSKEILQQLYDAALKVGIENMPALPSPKDDVEDAEIEEAEIIEGDELSSTDEIDIQKLLQL